MVLATHNRCNAADTPYMLHCNSHPSARKDHPPMFDAKKLLDAMVAGNAQAADPAKPKDIFGDLMGKLQQGVDKAGLGNAAERAKQVLGQATSGVKDAAGKVEQATGAGAKIDELVKQLSGGQGTGDLVAKAKEMIAKNPTAAGALAGVLGGILLGTRTGRGLTWDAAKLGGLVLVGGLAYKAYQNYQGGKPALDIGGTPAAAPSGSGFEADRQSNDDALLYLRAMIAAAAADGTIDADERERIMGGLERIGIDSEAKQFLDAEFARPASPDELAAQARSPETKAQVYTAARMTIDPDLPSERHWLSSLANALGLDPGLVAHIDAEVKAVRT
jgi:uncharacterized membrane protein YebE (DUF533 family)